MATAQNMIFGGSTLVDVASTGGFYGLILRTPNDTNSRDITLINTAYRFPRITGAAQDDATAQTFAFNCISNVASWAAGETLIATMTTFLQNKVAQTLRVAMPTYNGTFQNYTNMMLDSFPMGAPVIRAPAQGNIWRVHFQIKFVRYGA